MSDNKVIRLQVLDRTKTTEKVEEKVATPPVTNVSNPIYKKMLAFHHAKIGEKLSVKDLLR